LRLRGRCEQAKRAGLLDAWPRRRFQAGTARRRHPPHGCPGPSNPSGEVFTRLTATGEDGTDTAIRLTRTDLIPAGYPERAQDVTAVLAVLTP